MGFFSSIIKAVTKPIKKIAKKIVNVGKKIVKGIGKAVGKLGPLASIALMAIPGMQAFAAGMWSSMGVTSVIGQRMLTSAALGFVTSGGNLKAAVAGAALAGIGTAIGGGISGAKEGVGFFEGASKALSEQSSITSFAGGMEAAKVEWGKFTDGVENFFKGAGNGDVSKGMENVIKVDQTMKPDGSDFNEQLAIKSAETPPAEPTDYWKDTPESLAKKEFAADIQNLQKQGFDIQNTKEYYDAAYAGRADDWASSLSAGDYMAKYGGTSQNQFANIKIGKLNNEILKAGYDPSLLQEELSMFETPFEKADWLETKYGELINDPEAAKNVFTTKDWLDMERQRATYNVGAANIVGTTTTSMEEPVKDDNYKLKIKPSLLSPTASSSTLPSFVTEGGYEKVKSQISAGAGQAGYTGTDPLKQYQPLLVAQIEQEREKRARLAQMGWGIA